ncbi:hypothetical protein J6Z37_01770 [Candidatus Saccharibacteria bacterium]|nr:hypothetical protein [Candidatus Saccharibacteria bacterium]
MFFDDVSAIEKLSKDNGFSIFLIPEDFTPAIENTFIVSPDEKSKIGIEKIREISELCTTKQPEDFYIVVKNADVMNIPAQNAFLKLLEEPSEHYHFVLLAKSLSSLLPTVLSRGNLFILKQTGNLEKGVLAEEDIKNYARKLLSAQGKKLVQLADEITKDKAYKKKDNGRVFMLRICETAIEIAYKSFFKTKNPIFLKKLQNLLALQDNLKRNGNIKLHLVADLC